MLIRASTADDDRATLRRSRAVVAAVIPTARVAHLGAAAATVALAAIPTIVAVLWGAAPIAFPFLAVCLLSGATLGWAAEDPAADLLAAMPVPSVTRLMLRVSCVALVASFAVALTALIAFAGPGPPPAGWDRMPEAVTAATVALAVGLVAARHGERATGPMAVTAGVLGTGVTAALASRWPALLPTFAAGPTHDRWWVLAALAVATAARSGRDPGRS